MATVHVSLARRTSAPTSRFSFGDVWYSYDLRCVQPSLSATGVVTLSGHFASGLYAAHAALIAASASTASFAGTSTSAMNEPPSGASRTVAGPRTTSDQPAGATNVLPATVVLGVSAVIFSAASSVRAAGMLTKPEAAAMIRIAGRRTARMVAPSGRGASNGPSMRWTSDPSLLNSTSTGGHMRHSTVLAVLAGMTLASALAVAEEKREPKLVSVTDAQLKEGISARAGRNYAWMGYNTPEIHLQLPAVDNSAYADVTFDPPKLLDKGGKAVAYEVEQGLYDAGTHQNEVRFMPKAAQPNAPPVEFAHAVGTI